MTVVTISNNRYVYTKTQSKLRLVDMSFGTVMDFMRMFAMFSGLFFFYFILFPFGTDYYDKREISGNKAFIKLCEMSYM